jgi:putative hydrolase of the HAD superfamily
MSSHTIQAVLFDFGGVLAEEGFRKGLSYIASLNGLDPEEFFKTAQALIISSGYLTGRSTEADYWDQLRTLTGISGNDCELRQIILKRFILRDWMIDLVKSLKASSVRVAILSDQTNWLDELDSRLDFFTLFDFVFNSFHLGKSKNDPSLFIDVLNVMGLGPHETLFIDDTIGHVLRARSKGLHAIHYTGKEPFLIEMKRFCP